MKTKHIAISCFLFLSTFLSSAQENNNFSIPEKEYYSRVNACLNILDSGTAMVLETNELMKRSNNQYYKFRQESNLLYLTGVNKPSCLILYKDGWMIGKKRCRSIFFGQTDNNEEISISYPNIFDTVLTINYYIKQRDSLLSYIKKLYYSSPGYDDLKTKIDTKYPNIKMVRAAVLLSILREIKSENEIELIRKSISLTEAGILRAIKDCKPGIWEYELEADIVYECIKGGGDYQAYPCIIGSGPNSLIIHYSDNNRQTKQNELVVIDVGAEYKGYASDITRTIPVSGKYTTAQKEIYSVVLETRKEILKFLKPGVSFMQIDSIYRAIYKKYGYGNYVIHGVTHSVGVDVHDPVATMKLKPGMIITVEPGIYISQDDKLQPEAKRGIGIRIEDDVLITSDGYELLSKGIPVEIEEIEELMKKN